MPFLGIIQISILQVGVTKVSDTWEMYVLQ